MSALETLIPKLDAAFDALERNDLEAFVEISGEVVASEVEFHSAIGSVVGGSSYTGLDGVRSWFGDLLETADELHYRDRRYETTGDRFLLMFSTFELIGAAGQVPVSNEVGTVFEFEGGRCVRINSFLSHAEARAFAEARVA